jgi:hypothetical protein
MGRDCGDLLRAQYPLVKERVCHFAGKKAVEAWIAPDADGVCVTVRIEVISA